FSVANATCLGFGSTRMLASTDSTPNNVTGVMGHNSSGAAVAGIEFVNVNHGGGGTRQGALSLFTITTGDAISRIYMDPSGNVGIGTTNPGASLEISGCAVFRSGLRLDSAGVKCITAEMLIVDGKIGIGTTDPQQSMSVDGYMNVDQSNSDTGATGGGAYHGISFGNASGESIGSKRSAGGNQYGLDFYTGWEPRMCISSGGSIGMGLQNPSARLHVTQSGSQTTAIIAGNGGANYQDWPVGWGGGLATWDICCASLFYSGLSLRSDQRLKKDVSAVEGEAVERLMQLRPVSFRWKDTKRMGDGIHYGFIAQEMEQLFPELVTGSGSPEQSKSISLQELTAVLTKAVQELKVQNQMLNNVIQKLESDNSAINARLQELENGR
ncbi:MAG: tail fiber domain-containing protein, partial [Candidatus Wallbacteria bacterium]|nr:tail fiber domain-containing protein [Candidatus Wallbacteria bacterium]